MCISNYLGDSRTGSFPIAIPTFVTKNVAFVDRKREGEEKGVELAGFLMIDVPAGTS